MANGKRRIAGLAMNYLLVSTTFTF